MSGTIDNVQFPFFPTMVTRSVTLSVNRTLRLCCYLLTDSVIEQFQSHVQKQQIDVPDLGFIVVLCVHIAYKLK